MLSSECNSSESEDNANAQEIARINEAADELNREAEDVSEYQVIVYESDTQDPAPASTRGGETPPRQPPRRRRSTTPLESRA